MPPSKPRDNVIDVDTVCVRLCLPTPEYPAGSRRMVVDDAQQHADLYVHVDHLQVRLPELSLIQSHFIHREAGRSIHEIDLHGGGHARVVLGVDGRFLKMECEQLRCMLTGSQLQIIGTCKESPA